MTEQEKKNIAAVLAIARGYIAEDKRAAVERGDFETSLRIASNEARLEQYFASRGITIGQPGAGVSEPIDLHSPGPIGSGERLPVEATNEGENVVLRIKGPKYDTVLIVRFDELEKAGWKRPTQTS